MRYLTSLPGDLEMRDEGGFIVGRLPRYAVWEVNVRGKARVIDTDDDLLDLRVRNGLDEDAPVYDLKGVPRG